MANKKTGTEPSAAGPARKGGAAECTGIPRAREIPPTERVTTWSPQPKQRAFMARPEWEALYGGAAGGGKSDALVMEALRQVDIPNYRALILRKTFPELRELIDKTQFYYTRAFPRAKYNASQHTWTFPSGAKIIFGSMQHDKDKLKYQGQAFDFIGFDELTHFTWDEYSYLFSRCRPSGPGTRCYIRSTTNPGGVGHGWVKERFISAAPPLTPIEDEIEWRDLDGTAHTETRKRIFVPATIFDNQALLKNDPGYIASLAGMPVHERDALLYGSWDSFEGQVFTEWRNDPAHYMDHRGTHVIEPFEIPADWAVWCGLDWGYRAPFSVSWYAVDRDRRLYKIREYYGIRTDKGKIVPNTGVEMNVDTVADKILAIEADDPNLRGRRILRVGDPAIWGSQSGQSIGGTLEKKGLYFEKGDNARLDGKMQVHYRLAFDDAGIPMLYVFRTCRNFIRTFPALVYDERDVEDVDTSGEDHAYDELRYICMRNPIAPPKRAAETVKPWNPLDTEDREDRRYAWFRRY